MTLYLLNLWNKTRSNFLIFPSFMALLTILLSFMTIHFDRSYHINHVAFFWEGGAEGARQLLGTIAGSIITITGVVFSITIVAVALASNQYGSRAIPNFMKDIGNQIVLGTFISTSLYALLILRTIRSDSEEMFIPNLSITISLGLCILSLILLNYFIHHISKSVQSSEIISRISSELLESIKKLKKYEIDEEKEIEKNTQKETVCYEKLTSSTSGYLQIIDYEKINKIAIKEKILIDIHTRPGLFLLEGSLLATTNFTGLKDKILEAFTIGKDRTATQDIEYLFDQLVSITLHFLSINNNDTYSTNYCIDQLGAALSILCTKSLNPPLCYANSHIRLIDHQLTFEGVLDTAFNQIRQFSKKTPSVLIHLLETFTIILRHAKSNEQIRGLKKHAEMAQTLGEEFFQEQDKLDLRNRFRKFEEVLRSKITI